MVAESESKSIINRICLLDKNGVNLDDWNEQLFMMLRARGVEHLVHKAHSHYVSPEESHKAHGEELLTSKIDTLRSRAFREQKLLSTEVSKSNSNLFPMIEEEPAEEEQKTAEQRESAIHTPASGRWTRSRTAQEQVEEKGENTTAAADEESRRQRAPRQTVSMEGPSIPFSYTSTPRRHLTTAFITDHSKRSSVQLRQMHIAANDLDKMINDEMGEEKIYKGRDNNVSFLDPLTGLTIDAMNQTGESNHGRFFRCLSENVGHKWYKIEELKATTKRLDADIILRSSLKNIAKHVIKNVKFGDIAGLRRHVLLCFEARSYAEQKRELEKKFRTIRKQKSENFTSFTSRWDVLLDEAIRLKLDLKEDMLFLDFSNSITESEDATANQVLSSVLLNMPEEEAKSPTYCIHKMRPMMLAQERRATSLRKAEKTRDDKKKSQKRWTEHGAHQAMAKIAGTYGASKNNFKPKPYRNAGKRMGDLPCLSFGEKGSCKFGEKCRYKHVKMTEDQLAKATEEVKKKALLNKQKREEAQRAQGVQVQANAKSASTEDLNSTKTCTAEVKAITTNFKSVYKVPDEEMDKLLHAIADPN